MDIFGELQEVIKKDIYVSNFDFGSYEIEEKDIEFIKSSEQKLRKNFMAISNSLYDICTMLNQVSLKFKNSGDFMKWYQANGLNKDNISEFNKRFILFNEFKEKKDLISSLSNQSVKLLTHKDVTYTTREKIIKENITKAETIKQLLRSKKDQGIIEFNDKPKTHVNLKKFEKMKTNLTKVKSSEELKDIKSEIGAIEKYLKEINQIVKNKEDELDKKNNLTLL